MESTPKQLQNVDYQARVNNPIWLRFCLERRNLGAISYKNKSQYSRAKLA